MAQREEKEMKDTHINEILERSSFTSLSESERDTIQAHTAGCVDCAKAYRAAMISDALLKERVVETIEPSPFFHTRVMAAWRERQSEPALSRLWRAAGALASSMVAAVVLLAALTFWIPAQAGLESSAFNAYSAEDVILNQSEANQEQVSDAQILTTLYGSDEDAR